MPLLSWNRGNGALHLFQHEVLILSRAVAARAKMPRASSSNSRPAAVSSMCLPTRSNSLIRNSSSSVEMAWLAADCARLRSRAALREVLALGHGHKDL